MNELLDEAMGSVDRARMLALAKQVDVTFAADDLAIDTSYPVEPTEFARLLDNLLSNGVNAVDAQGSVRAHPSRSRRRSRGDRQ